MTPHPPVTHQPRQAAIAHRNHPCPFERSTTTHTISRKTCRHAVVQQYLRCFKWTSKNLDHRAPATHAPVRSPTGWTCWIRCERLRGRKPMQGFAEDTPHSMALQVGPTAPWLQYKPAASSRVNHPFVR